LRRFSYSMSKAEKTKQFIIKSIGPVFNTKGFAGTSLSDIEKATGLSKGSIYGNFQNKDEIAIEAYKYNISLIANYLKKNIAAQNTAIEKLMVFPRIYRNFSKYTFLRAGCPIFNTSAEADDTHPALRSHAKTSLKKWKTMVEQIVKEGVKCGELEENTDEKEIAAVLISLIEGAMMIAKLEGKNMNLNLAMTHLEQYILNLKA
jgi:TetR/AcrR family transcriptional regulator, transcriptional repressor for nem operon